MILREKLRFCNISILGHAPSKWERLRGGILGCPTPHLPCAGDPSYLVAGGGTLFSKVPIRMRARSFDSEGQWALGS